MRNTKRVKYNAKLVTNDNELRKHTSISNLQSVD